MAGATGGGVKLTGAGIEGVSPALLEAIAEVMKASANEIKGRIQLNISEMKIAATKGGGLFTSWHVTQVVGPSLPRQWTWIGSSKPYAAYVEHGTAGAKIKPRRWPPLEPFIQWVATKLRFEEVGGKRKARWPAGKMAKRSEAQETSILKMARRIRAKVYWYGTKPRHYIKRALDSLGMKYMSGPDADGTTMEYKIDAVDWMSKVAPRVWSEYKKALDRRRAGL